MTDLQARRSRCRFLVHGAASPDLPLRVLNLLAQHGALLDCAEVRRVHDQYVMKIDLADLSVPKSGTILEKIRAIVQVASAEVVMIDLRQRDTGGQEIGRSHDCGRRQAG